MWLGDKVALEDLQNGSICAIFEEGIMRNRDYGVPVYLVYVDQIFPNDEFQTLKMKQGIIEKGQMVRYRYCHPSIRCLNAKGLSILSELNDSDEKVNNFIKELNELVVKYLKK